MQFDDADIQAITESVWQAILGLEIAPCPPPDEVTADALIGRVAVVGAWHGTMVVACPLALARRVGAIMFGLEPEVATVEQARDAVSEITNMIGGNLKALLPEPCQLLFPEVSCGSAPLDPAGGHPIARVGFACEAEVFSVAIREDDAAGVHDAASE
jgi:chemotaxis protein CheX